MNLSYMKETIVDILLLQYSSHCFAFICLEIYLPLEVSKDLQVGATSPCCFIYETPFPLPGNQPQYTDTQ